MGQIKSYVSLLAIFALVALVGCGGGGNGFSQSSTNPALGVTNANLPALLSGQSFADIGLPTDYEIPLTGGCGGPYVIAVISGDLPPGIETDVSVTPSGEKRHHLIGLALEKGTFNFRLQITDTACTPFQTTTQSYNWVIGEGPLAIVGASPAIIPEAEYADANPARPGIDALDTTVYGSLVAIDLIAAGGVPPYVCSVIDDQADPDDDHGLPQGVNFAIDSSSMVGSPSEVGPNGAPFLITFRVTDFVGNQATRKLWWKIDTPPIIIANPSIADGTSGVVYSEAFQIVDGVPPFRFELVDAVPGPDIDGNDYSDIDWTVNPPVINSVDPISAGGIFTLSGTGPASNKLDPTNPAMTYPPTSGPGSASPYSPYPSEGLFLVDGDINGGTFSGLPRRAGDFTIFVHAFSTLVPNNRGQHGFKAFSHNIAVAPALAINFGFTVEGTNVGLPGDGYPNIPEAEVGVLYNPDSSTNVANGLKFLATGGVQEDGYFDAPHDSQRLPNLGEIEDAYRWTANMVDLDSNLIVGLEMFATSGQFGTQTLADANSMDRSGRRVFSATVIDQQLPDADNNPQTNNFGVSVGPDTVVITHSTTSLTTSDFWWRENNRFRLNDELQTIQKVQMYSGGTTRSVLDGNDMAATHGIPSIANLTATNELGALISGVTAEGATPTGGSANLDLLRCVVNATGWWDDNFQMNPKGARPLTHCDPNRTDTPYGQFGSSYSNMGNHQPPCSSVDLPDVGAGVLDAMHSPANGIYANGGLLYHFESNTHYGMFIVRPDAKIYVPFAEQKPATNSSGFGDGMLFDKAANVHSMLRAVQMTVSPDGRFAAMKLKADQNNLMEHADLTRILLVSLTGEKMFGETVPGANDGSTYRIVNSDCSALTGGGNRILYASSMALSNNHLYFLIGTQSPSSNSDTSSSRMYYQSWRGHFLMRLNITSGAVEKLPGPSSDPSNYWKQDDGLSTTMQTVFHHHGPNASSSSTYWGLIETYTSYGRWPYHRYFHEDGMNFHEHNVAPTPFRVSADGRAVAFFAAEDYAGTSNANVYNTFAWVDFQGGGATRITSARRHHSVGGGRGYNVVHGPNEYANWGRYHGPTPGIEISDNGLAVAFNYSNATTMSSSASYTSSANYWRTNSEELILTRSTSGTWGAFAESEITKNTFGGSHRWRFGSVAFTKNGNGVVFWGGAPMYQSNYSSYSYNQSFHFQGCFYVHKVGDTDKVTSMQAVGVGGSSDGAGKVYTSTSKFAPTSTSGKNNRFGAVCQSGGFMSKNRNFMYVHNVGAVSSSEGTGSKFIGLNVSSADSSTINGHAAGRGFVPGAWPSRRGVMPFYYYYYGNYYPLQNGYAPSKMTGSSYAVMAKDTGWVYWGSNYQYTGPSNNGSNSYGQWVYPTYYNFGYGYGGMRVYGFNADLGGAVAHLSQPGWNPQSTGTRQLCGMIEVSRDGSRLAYQYFNDTYTYYKNREMIRWVHNLDFDTANGALHAGFNSANDAGTFEGSNGRAGEAMAVVNGGRDVYYAFGPASNENTKNFTRQRFDASSGTWTRTKETGSTLTGRINPLWAGR